jgi:hypothetical protein
LFLQFLFLRKPVRSQLRRSTQALACLFPDRVLLA